jgi:hypothetical protein
LGRKNRRWRYFPKPETFRKNAPDKPFGLSASPLADHQSQYWPRTPGRLSVGFPIQDRIVDLRRAEFKAMEAFLESFLEISIHRGAPHSDDHRKNSAEKLHLSADNG